MLRSMLVGLDGSAFSDAAVLLGLRWAAQTGATLVGQTIIDAARITAPAIAPVGSGVYRAFREDPKLIEAKRAADELLARFTTRCEEAKVTSKPVQDIGTPAEEILAQAQRHDLILLGMETHFWPGSPKEPCDTLDRVLRSPPRPVVAVPEAVGEGNTAVIGYDGSLQAARTVAAYLATGLHERYQTVIVTVDNDFEEASRIADRAFVYLTQHGVSVKARPVETRLDPASILLDHTLQLKAGLLVMGAFGRSALHEFFFGSTTRGVLRGSKVPVMLYH
ncbi:MAG: universal stress protein [Planctomycetia bacterium]|nr:universal stress protein [Planctomycetia bacterium]